MISILAMPPNCAPFKSDGLPLLTSPAKMAMLAKDDGNCNPPHSEDAILGKLLTVCKFLFQWDVLEGQSFSECTRLDQTPLKLDLQLNGTSSWSRKERGHAVC